MYNFHGKTTMRFRRRLSNSQRLMKSMEKRDVRGVMLVVLLLPAVMVMALYLVIAQDVQVLKTLNNGEGWQVLRREHTESKKEGLCILHTNVVFVATPGCGSNVLQSVLFRFGFQKDLFVTLPASPGNPSSHEFRAEDFLQPSAMFSREWTINILAHQVRYNKGVMRRMFPENARYVTILRHPVRRFQSDFLASRMYRYVNQMADSSSKSLENYLNDPEYWESRKLMPRCTRNCMSAVLGFPLDDDMEMNDTQTVMEHIKKLDGDFSLILIYEYLDQSLVLLKRYMCWRVQDIIYDTRIMFFNKVPTQEYKTGPKALVDFTRLNKVDYLLFEHFNRTLWTRIAEEGPDFHDEVARFKFIVRKVTQHCHSNLTNKTAIFRAHRWHEKFRVSRAVCDMLVRRSEEWDGVLRRRYSVLPDPRNRL